MDRGECALTIDWGGRFRQYLRAGKQQDAIGLSRVPGSTTVLDRNSGNLVKCDKERCPFSTWFDDLEAWVNFAPYVSYEGYACAVNHFASPERQLRMMEFCSFIADRVQSRRYVIDSFDSIGLTGSSSLTRLDPFRYSHLDAEAFVAKGFPEQGVAEMIEAYSKTVQSPNVAFAVRAPIQASLNEALDDYIFSFLNETRYSGRGGSNTAPRPSEVSEALIETWQSAIREYDTRATSQMTVKDSYQRLRNVYYLINEDLNQLGRIKNFGYILVGVIFVLSVGLSLWVQLHKETKVIKSSQPFFLVIICIGTSVFGSSIIPLSMDDREFDEMSLDRACRSVPFLLALGWTIIFAALFSKLRRVNLVMRNAARFRRVAVSEKDVMKTFFCLFSFNVIILLIWTIQDPLFWERVELSNTESYGKCSVKEDSVTWKILVSLLVGFNFLALVLANKEAYTARRVVTDLSESQYIAMIMGSILQISVVGVPLLFLVEDNPTANYFIRVSIVFITSVSVLMLLFGPKIRAFYKKEDVSSLSSSGHIPSGNPSRISGLILPTSSNRKKFESGLSFSLAESCDTGTETAELLAKYRALENALREEGMESLLMKAGLTPSVRPARRKPLREGETEKAENCHMEQAMGQELTNAENDVESKAPPFPNESTPSSPTSVEMGDVAASVSTEKPPSANDRSPTHDEDETNNQQ
eukprot:scaffold8271_cov171-Amphora_coffeaeformis.AAC.3